INDDEDAIGRIVEVVEETCSDHDKGRIRFRGTTWKAVTEFGRIYPGQKARIYARKDMVWIVDPLEDSSEVHQRELIAEKIKEKSIIEKKKSRRFFVRKSEKSDIPKI
ncbi:NfeD family protein, partial [bacterium]|nr:NfeD family protein [bacterium]